MGMNSSYSALCCDTVINITPAGHYTTYLYFALWQICGTIFIITRESGYRRYTSFVLRQDIDANPFVITNTFVFGTNKFLTKITKSNWETSCKEWGNRVSVLLS